MIEKPSIKLTLKACTEVLNRRIEAKIRGFEMKNLFSAIVVLMLLSATLTGCSDENPKKEESSAEDTPHLFNFKPSDRSKNKGF